MSVNSSTRLFRLNIDSETIDRKGYSVTNVPSLPVSFDHLLLQLTWPLHAEIRERILEFAGWPGEQQSIVLLDSWDGNLTVQILREAQWHRTYIVNEPDEERFRLVSAEINAHWRRDDDLCLHNLATEEFLARLPEGGIMLMFAAQSLWGMSMASTLKCLKQMNRSLKPNGCVLLIAPVRPREPRISEELSVRLARKYPKGSLLHRMITERLQQILIHTEEDYSLMFQEAEFEYECIGKCEQFQCWMLTHAANLRTSDHLFSVL